MWWKSVTLEINHLTYIPTSISNPNIHFVDANNKQNKRCYDVLVYAPLGKAQPYAVVWYNGQWHKCYSEARTYRPFLGPIRTEVHTSDVAEESQPDEPATEDSATKDERELDTSIQNAPATIKVSSPGSTHREDQEPWAPLITPTVTNPSYSSPLPPIKQPKDTMGSATIAITSTTTTAPAAPATITSGSRTRGTGGGTTSSGGAPNPDAQDIRDAFDAALHQTGPGPPTRGGPNGPRGPGGLGGGAPMPILVAHLVPIPANPDVHVMGSPPQIFNGDRQQADTFINKLLTYICVNIGVLGFESPMR